MALPQIEVIEITNAWKRGPLEVARAIVNHVHELAGTDVATCQATNDQADTYAAELIGRLLAAQAACRCGVSWAGLPEPHPCMVHPAMTETTEA